MAAEDWKGLSGPTIEANTSSGKKGSQWNGDGTWQRWRTIASQQDKAFRPTHILTPKY